MTTRWFSYALKAKLPGSLCLIIIGTEGAAIVVVRQRAQRRLAIAREGGAVHQRQRAETVKGMGELRWVSYDQPYVSAVGE
jgi:hypothetical protein